MAEGQSECLGPHLASPISPAPHQRDDRLSVGRGAARPPSPAARGPDERACPSRELADGDREGRGETTLPNTNLTVEIDQFYSEIVTALLASASETAPVKSSNFRKPWWDDNLDYLKSASIETHRLWVEAGRPSQGPIFLTKQKAKSNYKKQIANNKNNATTTMSNSLQKIMYYLLVIKLLFGKFGTRNLAQNQKIQLVLMVNLTKP